MRTLNLKAVMLWGTYLKVIIDPYLGELDGR